MIKVTAVGVEKKEGGIKEDLRRKMEMLYIWWFNFITVCIRTVLLAIYTVHFYLNNFCFYKQ